MCFYSDLAPGNLRDSQLREHLSSSIAKLDPVISEVELRLRAGTLMMRVESCFFNEHTT